MKKRILVSQIIALAVLPGQAGKLEILCGRKRDGAGSAHTRLASRPRQKRLRHRLLCRRPQPALPGHGSMALGLLSLSNPGAVRTALAWLSGRLFHPIYRVQIKAGRNFCATYGAEFERYRRRVNAILPARPPSGIFNGARIPRRSSAGTRNGAVSWAWPPRPPWSPRG